MQKLEYPHSAFHISFLHNKDAYALTQTGSRSFSFAVGVYGMLVLRRIGDSCFEHYLSRLKEEP